MTKSYKESDRCKIWCETSLPDGSYEGLMTGYTIRFKLNDKNYMCTVTHFGVRGIDVAVIFKIVEGKVDESSIIPLGSI